MFSPALQRIAMFFASSVVLEIAGAQGLSADEYSKAKRLVDEVVYLNSWPGGYCRSHDNRVGQACRAKSKEVGEEASRCRDWCTNEGEILKMDACLSRCRDIEKNSDKQWKECHVRHMKAIEAWNAIGASTMGGGMALLPLREYFVARGATQEQAAQLAADLFQRTRSEEARYRSEVEAEHASPYAIFCSEMPEFQRALSRKGEIEAEVRRVLSRPK